MDRPSPRRCSGFARKEGWDKVTGAERYVEDSFARHVRRDGAQQCRARQIKKIL